MIKSLVYIIPALVVGILLGLYLSIQDYSKLREITLGELLNVLTNLFFMGIVTYYIVQRSNTDLKRREMLWGYFDELRENCVTSITRSRHTPNIQVCLRRVL